MAERPGSRFVETEDQQKLRFQVELEFVQCLANPSYLNCKFLMTGMMNPDPDSPTRRLGSEWSLQKQVLYQLPELFAVLEATGVRKVPEVSSIIRG